MEGISHEVASLAGTLGLGKLVFFYDDNGISIDGEVEGWFTDDTPKRFESYGWQVIPNVDGHDADAIRAAIDAARANTDQPTIICCKTIIGFGSPNKQGKEDCHGAPLGDDEIALTREALGWQHGPFDVPSEIYAAWDAKEKGAAAQKAWEEKFAAYEKAESELAAEFKRRMAGELPADFSEKAQAYIQECQDKGDTIASRKASQNTLNAYGPLLPELMGGSADLAGSNLTIWSGCKGVTKDDASGNYIYYGVREFGMAAIMNGIALHGGFVPYGATFLIFMEYCRNAVRMAALMKQRSIFVFTHDSIGLGEDGPTHQPIEQMASLRTTPNMSMWRPADTVESAVAWKAALERNDGPTAMVFSRQNLPHQQRDAEQLANVAKGGYVLSDSEGTPELILIATGSEVALAQDVAAKLREQGKAVRVVSMPSTDVFDAQSAEYKQQVLPLEVTNRIAIEAGIADYWYKYVGLDGRVVGMTTFGESAPAGELFKEFGFTVDNIMEVADELTGRLMTNSTPFRIAINGYGRIGQCVLRALYENGYRDHLQVVAINELSDIDTIAHLTKYDSTHGRFHGEVAVDGDNLVVNGDRIRVLRHPDPSDLPWRLLDVDLVLECSGAYSDRATAEKHIEAGAQRLLFSQPGESDVDRTVVFGINDDQLNVEDVIVAAGSCTTNCLVPVIKVLDDAFGVEQGSTTTIHAAMNDQPVIDAYHHQDLRRTRSALHNIVPVDTGLARGIERLLPHMEGRFSSVAMRVPTLNVSAIDMVVNVREATDVTAVNQLLQNAAKGGLKGILGYTDELLASSDFNHDAHSGVVDGGQTRVTGGTMVKVLCWFDNEWGFANRMLDVSKVWLEKTD